MSAATAIAARWAAELDDMRQVMGDAAAAMTVDVALVDAETRDTVRMFVEARRDAERAGVLIRQAIADQPARLASALTVTGRCGGTGRGK